MQLLVRRFFAIRRPWFLVIVPVLLSAAFTAAAVIPDAQDPPPPPPPNCMEDVVGDELQCTANDVRVSRYILVEGPDECRPGEVIQVKLQAELESTAQNRYDIGLFVAQDGGNARTGLCYKDYLAPPLATEGLYDPGALFTPADPLTYTGGGPFLTSEDEPDQCGDIEQGVLTFRDVGEVPSDADSGPEWVEVKCQDNVDAAGAPGADQVADVGTCVSWDNQVNARPACISVTDALPGTGSKCNCSSVQIAGLTVLKGAQLEVIKDLVPGTDPGKFDLLIDGAVASGADGVGGGGSTGPVEVSAGTPAEPGADHTVGEAAHPGSGTDLVDYDISYACFRNAETTAFASGAGPGPVTVPLMPDDDVVCRFTNKTIDDNPPPPDETKTVCVDGYVIDHREQPVDGTALEENNQPFQLVVTATNEEGETFTADVGEDGYFKFEALDAAKSYKFSLDLPVGWQGIAPYTILANGNDDPVTEFTHFDESETCYRIVFKIRHLVTIPVMKWEEKLDGTVVPGEDWLITATPVKDPFAKVVTATVTSGYAILTLTPGTWIVAETVKTGWIPLTPSKVTRVVDEYEHIVPPKGRYPIVFKNREPVCHPQITVTKIGYGTNPDGEIQGLGVFSGWKYTVSRADKTIPSITRITGGDGRAVFDDLLPGVYKVTETAQPGWKVRGDNPMTVFLKACEKVEVTFENDEVIGELSISGKKLFKAWVKPYKGTPVGLAGWKITATLAGTSEDEGNLREISTTTDALGEYEFTVEALEDAGMGFPGASIEVCEEDRDNWIHVTPECVTVTFPYPVPPGYEGEVVNFTNVQDPPLPAAAASDAATVGGACSDHYSVRSGDTLANIASEHGVSMSSLIAANGIRNADRIYIGQSLCIR